MIREVKPGSFVFELNGALPAAACEDMIRRFEASVDEQYAGRLGQGAAVEPQIKRSTDLVVSGKPQWRDVDRLLFPPFWTHQHRGVTLQQGVKYIATTWVVFA